MPDESYGIPEVSEADLKGKPFRLNAILRFIAKRIETALGNTGNVRYGSGPFAFNGLVSVTGGLTADSASLTGLPTYANNAAAKAGGLATNSLYRTATGVLMIVYD